MNESRFLKIYQRQQESGLTVREFCSNEGIPTSTYYYWYKKTKHMRGNQEFIPLVVKSSHPVSVQGYANNASPVSGSRNTGEDMLLEVEYPNGTRLRINQDLDLDHLRTLVCLLD